MSSEAPQPLLSRRKLIQTGLVGSLLLSGGSLITGCSHALLRGDQDQSNRAYRVLVKEDVELIVALLPAIVGEHWPSENQDIHAMETVQRVDLFISRMGPHNIQELRKLFDLLTGWLTRGVTTGVWSNWTEVSPAQANEFLNSWKHSGFSLFNGAYNALCDVLGFAWYSNPENTAADGYAGPPAYVTEALPQFRVEPAKESMS